MQWDTVHDLRLFDRSYFCVGMFYVYVCSPLLECLCCVCFLTPCLGGPGAFASRVELPPWFFQAKSVTDGRTSFYPLQSGETFDGGRDRK